MRRIARRVPGFVGAVVAVSKDGRHGGAAVGWRFEYSMASGDGAVATVAVNPLNVSPDAGSKF
jgi:N4-(beta-N-acetylglucosaminyl)-L-asparaginase